ncbi:hypothetical protein AJ79_00104 [Helicocarpus griseus UAMH5409]|uniref:Hepatocellular carcinoma-associated antigen 59-domain-containing protein n=1 Tax=Helicocarpus griseus UAMH5409 TaxID=1447875 RepID=A0A2B7YD02_9EURO|nr:hypothetical protein AJ79_00104 [Helicocarpus griseus UAMH5409]
MSAMETEEPEPLFRPVKRRKFLRKRPDPSVEEQQPPQPSPDPQTTVYNAPSSRQDGAASESHPDEPQEADTGIPDIIRLRKSLKARRGGVGFTAATKPASGDEQSDALVEVDPAQDPESTIIQGISDRFVAHTGQKVDVDKHMMAYIESEMAKRHQQQNGNNNTSNSNGQHETTPRGGIINPPFDLQLPQRQPASLGKLHEIDLGPDAKLRNIERTEAATRRLVGDERAPDEEEEARDDPAKKARPGKDGGKNWRGRKRRNSEDIRRDKLVEEVLRESKLDVYDEPEAAVEQQNDDDMAADDRIAEQFRRDFLDAIHSRRRGARAKTSKTAKTDVPRGPKLGGSRSARAAMREKAAQK